MGITNNTTQMNIETTNENEQRKQMAGNSNIVTNGNKCTYKWAKCTNKYVMNKKCNNVTNVGKCNNTSNNVNINTE